MAENLAIKLRDLLNQSKWDEIISFANEDAGQWNSTEKRVVYHYEGMALAAQGYIRKSVQQLNKALEFGPNVQLLRDLAAGYYQLEEVDAWRETTELLRAELKSNKDQLCFASQFTSQLMLAKFDEEDGRLGKALDSYTELYNHPECTKGSRAYFELLPQLLRLKSLLPIDKQLGEIYAEMVGQRPELLSEYWNFEWEHSLMLCEYALIGPKHSLERIKRNFQENGDLNHIDQRLLVFDFLEETLIRDQSIPPWILKEGERLRDRLSSYETQLLSLAKEVSETDSGPLFSSISMGLNLRLLLVEMARTEDMSYKAELKKRFDLLLISLDQNDKDFWVSRLGLIAGARQLSIELNVRNKSIMFHQRVAELQRKRTSFNLLCLLFEQNNWDVESIIQKIWDSSFTPEHFNRLRMAVHRTNQILQELTSFKKCIEISGESVNLNANVVLRSSTEIVH